MHSGPLLGRGITDRARLGASATAPPKGPIIMRTDVRQGYGTNNRVLIEARINHDPYDEFGWCQEWRFAIAQFLTDLGEYVPDFRGADDIRDEYPYECLASMGSFVKTGGEIDELFYALKILDRYREWLRLAGRDY